MPTVTVTGIFFTSQPKRHSSSPTCPRFVTGVTGGIPCQLPVSIVEMVCCCCRRPTRCHWFMGLVLLNVVVLNGRNFLVTLTTRSLHLSFSVDPISVDSPLPSDETSRGFDRSYPIIDQPSNVDLIFWSERRMISKQANISELYLVHTYDNNEGSMKGFQDVLNVDFRVCRNSNSNNKVSTTTIPCPSFLSFNDTELANMTEYRQRFEGKHFQLLFPRGTQPRDAFLNRKLLQAATFWSEEYQQHVRFPFRGRLTPMSCRRSTSCPDRCPRHPREHRYVFDTKDRVCKSSHPDALPPNRSFGGPCTCVTTCYTPDAVAFSTTWPWKSETERAFFAPYWNDTVQYRKQILMPMAEEKQRRRMLPHSTYQARFSCPEHEHEIEPPPAAGDFSHHLMFFPQAKLIFCGIPKVRASGDRVPVPVPILAGEYPC